MSDLDLTLALFIGACAALTFTAVVLVWARQRTLDFRHDLHELAESDSDRRRQALAEMVRTTSDLTDAAVVLDDTARQLDHEAVVAGLRERKFQEGAVGLVRDLHEIVQQAAGARNLEAEREIAALRLALQAAEDQLATMRVEHDLDLREARAAVAAAEADRDRRIVSPVVEALHTLGPQAAGELAAWIEVDPGSAEFLTLTQAARSADLIRSGRHVNGRERVYWLADADRPEFAEPLDTALAPVLSIA